MKKLILFGTLGCHLCEEAEVIVASLMDGFADDLQIEITDIAEQEQWQEKYAIRIPILYHPETGSELGWPFDQLKLQEFIKELIR